MAAAVAPEIEEEIRFRVVDPATPDALLTALRPLAAGEVRDRSYRDRYLDHPEFRLLRRRLALRLRTEASGSRVELKGAGEACAGVWQRQEWQQPAEAAWSGAVGELADGPVRRILLELCSRDAVLMPISVCEIHRRVLRLKLAGGGVTELFLDRGEVRVADRRVVIDEVELEWRAGCRAQWRVWAGELASAFNLAPAAHSKFALGLSLWNRADLPGMVDLAGERDQG
ncbi:MAG: CYTH domain-containing protein [Magnetococcales bacterium]|nr:CYTH domain-containing protein [Magnetococcales bacterium]